MKEYLEYLRSKDINEVNEAIVRFENGEINGIGLKFIVNQNNLQWIKEDYKRIEDYLEYLRSKKIDAISEAVSKFDKAEISFPEIEIIAKEYHLWNIDNFYYKIGFLDYYKTNGNKIVNKNIIKYEKGEITINDLRLIALENNLDWDKRDFIDKDEYLAYLRSEGIDEVIENVIKYENGELMEFELEQIAFKYEMCSNKVFIKSKKMNRIFEP